MAKAVKRQTSSKEGTVLNMKYYEDKLSSIRYSTCENLQFELIFFVISLVILVACNIYIHKKSFNNYNIKLNTLIIMYLSRRLFIQAYYYYRLREALINTVNYMIFISFLGIVVVNTLAILWSLLNNYNLYSFLSLFYMFFLQIPIFWFERNKKDDLPPVKEMTRGIKKIIYLSVEICYYAIFVPVLFSMKFSTYLNLSSIFLYTIFTWINVFFLLFAYNYYKKSAEMHFQTKFLGSWLRVKRAQIDPSIRPKPWTANTYFEKHSYIEHKGLYYVAIEDRTIIEPSNGFGQLLHVLFSTPRMFFSKIFKYQGSFTVFQIMFYSITDYNTFSLTLCIVSWSIFYYLYNLFSKIKKMFIK